MKGYDGFDTNIGKFTKRFNVGKPLFFLLFLGIVMLFLTKFALVKNEVLMDWSYSTDITSLLDVLVQIIVAYNTFSFLIDRSKRKGRLPKLPPHRLEILEIEGRLGGNLPYRRSHSLEEEIVHYNEEDANINIAVNLMKSILIQLKGREGREEEQGKLDDLILEARLQLLNSLLKRIEIDGSKDGNSSEFIDLIKAILELLE